MDLGEVAAGGAPAGAVEESDRHPWERARAEFVEAVLRDEGLLARDGAPLRVLDCGAGDAYVATRLARLLPAGSAVTCWDAEYSQAQMSALGDGAPRLAFTRERPTTRFSLLLLLDVLEHVAADE